MNIDNLVMFTRKRKGSISDNKKKKVYIAANEAFGDKYQYIISSDNIIADVHTKIDSKTWNVMFEDDYSEERRISILEDKVDKLTKTVEHLLKIVEEQDAKIKEQDAKIKEQDAKIKEQDAKIKEQDAKIKNLENDICDMKYDIKIIAKHNLIITAAETVLFMFGIQPPNPIPKPTYFTVKKNNCSTNRLLKKQLRYNNSIATCKDFETIFNSLIKKRNCSTVHFKSSIELKKSVDDCMRFFNKYDDLKDEYNEEYFMISNYDVFKTAYKF
ncbi:MAG: hypothetical protein ACRCZI_05765 [Cetobacterium sp.]